MLRMVLLVLGLILPLAEVPRAYAATAQAFAGSVSSAEWTNPGNATSMDDGVCATSPSGNFKNLIATNFGFSLPANAVIQGIQVDVKHAPPSPYPFALVVSLTTNGSTAATALSITSSTADTATCAATTFDPIGGSSELWMGSWSAATINDSNFGAILQSSSSPGYVLDAVRIVVTYTTPAATATPTVSATITPTHSPSRTPTRTSTRTPTHSPTQTPSHTGTHTPTQSPSQTATQTPTTTPTDSPSPTPTITPSATATITPSPTPSSTQTPTPTNTPLSPRIAGRPLAGATTLQGNGQASMACNPGSIQAFDCGPDHTCYSGDDFPIPAISSTRDANGHFLIALSQPLNGGQILYVTDDCFGALLLGPPTLVLGTVPAPTLSGPPLTLLTGILGGLGLWAVHFRWRRRTFG